MICGVKDAGRGEELFRVVIWSIETEDFAYDVTSSVKVNTRTRSAHSSYDVLSFIVDQTDDRELVIGEASGATPFSCDMHAAIAKYILDL